MEPAVGGEQFAVTDRILGLNFHGMSFRLILDVLSSGRSWRGILRVYLVGVRSLIL